MGQQWGCAVPEICDILMGMFTVKLLHMKKPIVLEQVRSIRMRKDGVIRFHQSKLPSVRFNLADVSNVRIVKPKKEGKPVALH